MNTAVSPENAPRIALACCSDAGYAPHATAMLFSAVSSTPEARFALYYLQDPDFPETLRAQITQAMQRFGTRAELHFVTVPDGLVQGLPLFEFMKPGAMRPVMWYRVFLPQLLPQEARVLYLDCDTLVVKSLTLLWQTALDGQPLAAVSNPFSAGYARNGKSWPANCGLARDEDYFNSGVMLLNLDYFRANDITHRVIEHGVTNAGWTRFGDQDSLVVVLHGARVPLHPRYNLMRTIISTGASRAVFGPAVVSEAIADPAILHFEGTIKPWNDPTQHPFGRLYTRVARQLPWPVRDASFGLMDVDNFLIRRDWVPLLRAFRRLLRLVGIKR